MKPSIISFKGLISFCLFLMGGLVMGQTPAERQIIMNASNLGELDRLEQDFNQRNAIQKQEVFQRAHAWNFRTVVLPSCNVSKMTERLSTIKLIT